MKGKILFNVLGVVWMFCTAMMISYIAKADFGGALIPNYIKAAVFGILGGSALLIAQEIYKDETK